MWESCSLIGLWQRGSSRVKMSGWMRRLSDLALAGLERGGCAALSVEGAYLLLNRGDHSFIDGYLLSPRQRSLCRTLRQRQFAPCYSPQTISAVQKKKPAVFILQAFYNHRI